MILSAVDLGILPLDVALFDQTVDLVGRVGLGDVEEIGELADRRLVKQIDDLQRERLHRAERTVSLPDLFEDAAEEDQLELLIDLCKILFQHSKYPLFFRQKNFGLRELLVFIF